MKNKIFSILITIAIIITGILIGNFFSNQKKPMRKRTNVAKQKGLEIIAVKNQDISIPIEISGLLKAYDKIDLYTEVSGILKRTSKRFIEGQSFLRGDILIKINDDVFRSNLLAQRSQLLNQLTLLLPDISIDFPESKNKWERYLSSYNISTTIPSLPKASGNKEKYYIAARNIFSTYYNIKSMEATLKKYTLTAPFNGKVSQGSINPGTLVRPGQKLGQFVKSGTLELIAPVRTELINHIPLNYEITLSALGISGTFIGKITRISPVIDKISGSVKVYIPLEDNQLRENMFLKGKILSIPIKDTMMIKNELLINGENKLYGVKNSKLFVYPVEKIATSGDQVLVKGLPDGMLILNEIWKEAKPGAIIPLPLKKSSTLKTGDRASLSQPKQGKK